MSARRRTTRTTKRSSAARIQRAGTRKQKLEEVTALRSQTIAVQVAQMVRKEIREAVSKELTARGYPVQSAKKELSMKSSVPFQDDPCAPTVAPSSLPPDRGMGPTLPQNCTENLNEDNVCSPDSPGNEGTDAADEDYWDQYA